MYVVITYDISEDKRRTKIHSVLKSYGQWVQYSVFECDLTEVQYARLRSRLNKLICYEEDSICFYFLRGKRRGEIERIGRQGKALAGIGRKQQDMARITVRGVGAGQDVRLLRAGRHARRRSAALNVENDQRNLGKIGQPDELAHQRDTWP